MTHSTHPFDQPASLQRRSVLAAAAAAGLGGLGFSMNSQAQSTWPAKPVTLVVPFPAGGGTDTFARPIAAKLSQQLGQQVLIENQGGAGGTVDLDLTADAPGDWAFHCHLLYHMHAGMMRTVTVRPLDGDGA